jgi:hypothetical protein
MTMAAEAAELEPAVTVTQDSVDPLFNRPVIEADERREGPIPHRYVRGVFEGTDARFSFYFPGAERYEGRFHHNTYPLATSSDVGPFPIAFEVAQGNLPFTLSSGAYYVQTNNGGAYRQGDWSIAAYRVNAAAAKFSRVVAAGHYGDHRPYGYLYGGSGGCFQTTGAAEHTSGVWDGFMPFVLGVNDAVPSNFTTRTHALRILRRRNRFPAILDAIGPGGSGDMYAGLDDEERAALREITLLGFPPRAWYAHESLGSGYLADAAPLIPPLDPSYVDDFWSKPGYLGADPAASIHQARFTYETTVSAVIPGPRTSLQLASLPDHDVRDAYLTLLSGEAAGKSLAIITVEGGKLGFARISDAAVFAAIRPGDKVRIDNSWTLALQTYQRHTLPTDETEYGWSQFRGPGGRPLYPQRGNTVANFFTKTTASALLTGRITAKMLMVQTMMDIDAFPWGADWYRATVRSAVGDAFDDRYALWFIDHAQHDNPQTPLARAHAVGFSGVLQQGLRDLARWVETGVKPSEPRYQVVESQIVLPARAAERLGPQPVVELAADGGARAEVRAGQSVTLTGAIEAPPGAGAVVSAEWDFEGVGSFVPADDLGEPRPSVSVSATHVYARAGTYYPVLRGVLQREGNPHSPFGRIENIGRARVVVS